MADFKTHLTASTILGLGYGGAAYGLYQMPASSCVLAAGLCGVSGMLPDIDSGPGRPLREITTFMAAVVPTILFGHLLRFGLSQEWIVLIGAGIYVGIRFGLAKFLRVYTVHRGMFHSLPAAAIFGELTYLSFYDNSMLLRCFVAGGVVLGFLSHLLLDEVYSVQWDGTPRLKTSFGTAIKLFSDGWWPNLSAYTKLGILTFLVLREPSVVQELYTGQTDQVVQNIKSNLGFVPASVASQGKQAAPKPAADESLASEAASAAKVAAQPTSRWRSSKSRNQASKAEVPAPSLPTTEAPAALPGDSRSAPLPEDAESPYRR